ncbi:hypothetical protein ACS0TY_023616 [Phlomoides rotata]
MLRFLLFMGLEIYVCVSVQVMVDDIEDGGTWSNFNCFSDFRTVEGHLQTFSHRERKKQGGISPKFVIIDDGWQSVGMDPISEKTQADNSAKFANRLTDIKENHKFQKDGKEGEKVEDPTKGIRHIVSEIKDQHYVKYVYVWHALAGYWGGVRPGVAGIGSL